MRSIRRGSNGVRDQVVGAELEMLLAVGGGDDIRHLRVRELGDRTHGGELHLLVDGRRADIERAAEDEREAQDVVDLVRIVERPVAMMAVGPRGLGFSGRISGSGLASARISGSGPPCV
jgi:hypothetical protein